MPHAASADCTRPYKTNAAISEPKEQSIFMASPLRVYLTEDCTAANIGQYGNVQAQRAAFQYLTLLFKGWHFQRAADPGRQTRLTL
jgi:hypothetical protein